MKTADLRNIVKSSTSPERATSNSVGQRPTERATSNSVGQRRQRPTEMANVCQRPTEMATSPTNKK